MMPVAVAHRDRVCSTVVVKSGESKTARRPDKNGKEASVCGPTRKAKKESSCSVTLFRTRQPRNGCNRRVSRWQAREWWAAVRQERPTRHVCCSPGGAAVIGCERSRRRALRQRQVVERQRCAREGEDRGIYSCKQSAHTTLQQRSSMTTPTHTHLQQMTC